jgi:hypothetical protein
MFTVLDFFCSFISFRRPLIWAVMVFAVSLGSFLTLANLNVSQRAFFMLAMVSLVCLLGAFILVVYRFCGPYEAKYGHRK